MDIILIFKNDNWTDHIDRIELTLNKQKGKGLKYNIKKLLFTQTEMKCLSFWVTHDGIEPINRKIESVNNIKPPTSCKVVRKCIYVISYYHAIWTRGSHTLSPLLN